MANVRRAILTLAIQGMNSSINATGIGPTGVSRSVNMQIKDQLLTTRPGIRSLKLGPDAEELRKLNYQGATHYNPMLGQSQQTFGENNDSIIIAAGGRKFNVVPGKWAATVSDVTYGVVGVDDALICWLFQAENYMIAQDGFSSTWIWDGVSQAFESEGYNVDEPIKSRLANAATAGGYAHGRILQVIAGHKVIVGDIIHKNQLTDPSNILNMTEQVYYATGSHFGPPSNLGEVMAVGILPLGNTMHGHDDVLIHCRHGVFSLKIDTHPREDWPTTAVSKHLLIGTSATGPFALVNYDGDQMFRSKFGIQTVRSAAQNSAILGNPYLPISEPVGVFLDGDNDRLLAFASMAKWPSMHRILCTTGLWRRGSNRGGKGMVVLNMNPDGSLSPNAVAWEGLWTMPKELGLPCHLVNATFADSDRMLILANDGESNMINEVVPHLRFDVDEAGNRHRISSQIITQRFPIDNMYNDKRFRDGRICLRNIYGELDWGVWARTGDGEPWVLWMKGVIHGADDCDATTLCDGLSGAKMISQNIDIGNPPESVATGNYIQLLVRLKGYCSVESISIGVEEADRNAAPLQAGEKVIDLEPCEYDDYEYTKGSPWTHH